MSHLHDSTQQGTLLLFHGSQLAHDGVLEGIVDRLDNIFLAALPGFHRVSVVVYEAEQYSGCCVQERHLYGALLQENLSHECREMARAVDRHLEFTNSRVRPVYSTWMTLSTIQQSWPTDVKDVLFRFNGRRHTTDWFSQAELDSGPQLKIQQMEPDDSVPLSGYVGQGGWVKPDPPLGMSVFQHQDHVPVDWLAVSQIRPEGDYPIRPGVTGL